MASKRSRRVASEGQYVCIYCLRRLSAQEFTREHVLSKAFGAFRRAPVLLHCVCRECNQFFGDELEVRFARNAFEGMLRYRNGVRTPSKGAIYLRYVELAIPETDGSDRSGIRLNLSMETMDYASILYLKRLSSMKARSGGYTLRWTRSTPSYSPSGPTSRKDKFGFMLARGKNMTPLFRS
jgi:hypothetical protein